MATTHWLEDAVNQGFVGVPVDLTPNANYTVAGVNAQLPTPETTVHHDPQHFYTVADDRDIGPTAGGGGTPKPPPPP